MEMGKAGRGVEKIDLSKAGVSKEYWNKMEGERLKGRKIVRKEVSEDYRDPLDVATESWEARKSAGNEEDKKAA